ncbi:MAG: Dihydroneopterin aldolase [Legionellaceae bacterium]
MDIIYLKDFCIKTKVGIYAWEQAITQLISLDIEIGAEINVAAETDNITDTLNYASLAESLHLFITTNTFKLIETLAIQVADYIHEQFKVSWIKLKVNKIGAIPNAKEVGVIIERQY